jgi:hypothetical protein
MRSFLNPALKIFAVALVLLCAALLFLPRKTSAGPPARRAVLVELFTSEGCSSCPPADALLGRLRQEFAGRGFEVVPLGLHVDYWNSLGWKDRFSSAEFSRRQEQYARALHTDGPYTPQMIVDGAVEFVGSDAARAQSAIMNAAGEPQTTQLEISVLADHPRFLDLHIRISTSAKGAEVMLAITEDDLVTKVGGGENMGHELRHTAVVRELRQLGSTTGSGNFRAHVPIELQLDWKRNDLRLIVFVQESPTGKVLGVASVPLNGQPR